MLLIWTLWQFHFNYMVSMYDTFFHTQRIYEIRLAFLQHTLPSWVNFNTFFNTGQAINGMYPDFTLWSLVLITNFLTPIHQIIAIRSLVFGLTFIVSFLSLNKRFDTQNAILAATIFTLSGSAIKDLTNEMQTGSAIVMIFAFPLLFTFKEAVESKKIDYKLIIKTALLMTIVINSHLLSAVVIAMVTGIFLIIETILKKNYSAWINLLGAALLTVILCLPVIYRILKISKSGLLAPFGKGTVVSDSLFALFSTTTWNGKSTISIASIILLLIAIIGFNKSKLRQLIPWLSIELVLILFCTNIVPWNLLEHLPILNTFQVANWRFAPFLGMIPLILILVNFNQKYTRIILLSMVVISYLMAIRTAYVAQYKFKVTPQLVTATTTEQVPMNATVKLTSSGINSNKLTRTLIPDYAPNSVPLEKNTNGASLDSQLIYLISNHLATTKQRDIALSHQSNINNVTFKAKNVPKGSISLPVFGYRTLIYHIYLNNHRIKGTLNPYGFITVYSKKDLKNATYKVEQVQPKLYRPLILISFILYVSLLGILIAPIFKKK